MSHTGSDPLAGRSMRAVADRTVDLVNALYPSPADPDAVADVLRAHGETDPLHLTRADVDTMALVARQLREVFAATDTGQAAARVNHLLAEHARPPRLTDHGGTSNWHLHLDSHDDAPWPEWMLTSSCMAFAVLIADRQRKPGGICSSPTCQHVYIALGRGAPRRFCSPRCATRERVAAHRRAGRPEKADQDTAHPETGVL
ncbi:CGNR zinc finger domain-containing protein [Nocardiopsis rhodophaea]